MRTPADKEPPLYVPAELEAEHLDEARRTVIRSCTQRSHPRARLVRLSGSWDRWTVAVAAHVTAAMVALVFTVLTRTWLAGIAVLIAVSASLGITLLVLSRIGAPGRHGHPD